MFIFSNLRYIAVVLVVITCVSMTMDKPPEGGGWWRSAKNMAYRTAANVGLIETDPVKRAMGLVQNIATYAPEDPRNYKSLQDFYALLKEYPQLTNEPLFPNINHIKVITGQREYEPRVTTLLIYLIGYVYPLKRGLRANSTYPELIKLAQKAGTDVNKTVDDLFPLSGAVSVVQPQIVKALLDAGSETEHRHTVSPLLQAVDNIRRVEIEYPHRLKDLYEVVKLLLDHGADLTARMPNGETVTDLVNKSSVTNRGRFLNLMKEYTKKKIE